MTVKPNGSQRGDQDRLAEAVARLVDAANELESLTDGQVDAVLDPGGATPLLLRHAQDVLVRSEARLRVLLKSAPIAVLELDREGSIRFLNPAAVRLLGMRDTTLVGKNFWRLPVLLQPAAGGTARLDALRDVTGSSAELPVHRPDGTIRFVRWHLVEHADSSLGNRSIIFAVDETPSRAAAAAAKQLLDARASRDRAEAVAEARKRLLAVLSHDLRTPLGAALLYGQLLQETTLDGHQREIVTRLVRSQTTLSNLFEDLFQFARSEHGKITIQPSPVTVTALLQAVEDVVAPSAKVVGVRFDTVADNGQREVCVDAGRLTQAIFNLCSNAVRLTPAEGRVRLIARCKDEVLEVAVIDEGPGVPDELREEIFTPFSRIDPSGGLGLGLAIARQIIAGHGGTLDTWNRKEGGAVFRIRIPLTAGPDAPDQRLGSERLKAPQRPARLGGPAPTTFGAPRPEGPTRRPHTGRPRPGSRLLPTGGLPGPGSDPRPTSEGPHPSPHPERQGSP